jgi:hypothetical protein
LGRDATREALDALRPFKEREGGEDLLYKSLRQRSNHVVALAADIVGARQDKAFEPALVQAWHRLRRKLHQSDPGCTGQVGVLQALEKLRSHEEDIFRAAAAHVQLEPAWGPPVDTATTLRCLGMLGVLRIGPLDTFTVLGQGLLDGNPRVREEACRAIGMYGHSHGVALIRLLLATEKDAGVFFGGVSALLHLDLELGLSECSAWLQDRHPFLPEVMLALGESRHPKVLPILQDVLLRFGDPEALTAAGLMRSEPARDWLLQVLASHGERQAMAAIEALKVYRFQEGTLDNALRAARRNPACDVEAAVLDALGDA